jgi:uncharacterized protein
MKLQFLGFLFVVGLILFSAYALVGFRMIVPSTLTGAWRTVAWSICFGIPAFHLLTFALYLFGAKGNWLDAMQWVNFTIMGLFGLVFSLMVARELLWLGLRGADALIGFLPEARGVLFNASSVAILVLAVIGTAWGFHEARRIPRVVEVDVPIADLPGDLNGFRIVQLTDFHVGPTIRRKAVEQIVRVTNSLDPDLIAFTGDLVDGSVRGLREQVAPLADLRAKHGSFFVTGNHEYYSGVEQWVEEAERLGFRVLLNQHSLIAIGDGRLLIAGVTDYNASSIMEAHRSDPARAIEGAPVHDVSVLLAHQPRSMESAVEMGYDLQLSGHTHGGQFIPWNLMVPLQQPIVSGLKQIERGANKMWVYVSRGTGYWGPPNRLGVPAEITVLKLVNQAP